MDTVKTVLYFLSKLYLVGYLKNSDYDKFNWIKKKIIDEFQDIDSDKLKNMLDVLDNLHRLLITQDFQNVQIIANVLREDIFSLVKLFSN